MGVYLSSRARIDFNMILNVRQSLWQNQGGPAIYLPYVRRADVVCSCFDLFISFDVFVQLWSPSKHGDSIGANQTIEPLCSLFFCMAIVIGTDIAGTLHDQHSCLRATRGFWNDVMHVFGLVASASWTAPRYRHVQLRICACVGAPDGKYCRDVEGPKLIACYDGQ